MRAERDRRLIEQTADLFSADYPLEELIERLCDALAVAFGASVTFVALASKDAQLRRVYAAAHGEKLKKDDAGIERDSDAFTAFTSGLPVMLRVPHAAMYVPIARGSETLGVLGIEHAQPKVFDGSDVRLLEAIARYLAIAIRDQRGAHPSVKPQRSSPLAYAAIVLLAVLLSIGIATYASIREQTLFNNAAALQRARALDATQQLTAYIGDSSQLASVSAAILGPIRGDRQAVETTLRRLLSAANDQWIYGIGVWYAPYAFDAHTRFYGPYVHRPRSNFRGAPVLTYRWMTPAYDYPSHYYYLLGRRRATDATVFTSPYFDTDYTYVSAVRAFYDSNGRFAGVVTVDSVMKLLSSMVRRDSHLPQEIVYVATQHGRQFLVPDGLRVLQFARAHGFPRRAVLNVPPRVFAQYIDSLGAGPREVTTLSTPQTHWIVYVSTSRATMVADAYRLRNETLIAVAIIWMLAGLLLAATARAVHAAESNRKLEIRQAALHSEIEQRIKVEEQLRESAYRDTLTGLANRAALLDQLETAIRRHQGWPDFFFAVLFLDLDRFNVVNDSLGHDSGDRLLELIARRLEPLLRPDDLLARLGGDEFVFLLKSGDDIGAALDLVTRIQKALTQPFNVSAQEIYVSASIGIALSERRYERPEEVLRDADVAMYTAKRRGRGQFAVFERSMHEQALAQLELESDLRRAIAREELFVEFQPIIALADGSVAGFEALVRWNHPTRGRMLPSHFISFAEQTGVITELDQYVLEHACKIAQPWVTEFPGLYLAVNVSAVELSRGSLAHAVSKALVAAGFPPSCLKIEITETAVMENAEAARQLLKALPEGVRIQIDDFGTGYSSLAYLQALPIDELKIDGSFIASMMRSAEAGEIVRAIVSLAQTLHLHVTAEGVELQEQVEMLKELAVDFAQGYLFTPSMSAQDALAFLRANSATRV